MSLHKELLALANSLQHDEPQVPNSEASYKDGLFDASDLLLEILDRYPLATGHEWKLTPCYWNIEDKDPDMRHICTLCGLDREFGDEGELCDFRRPTDEQPEELDNAS